MRAGAEDKRAGPDRSILRTVIAASILYGIAVRVWILETPMGGLDSDEAVVGLMARHILDGELPLYYWGQLHGGPHEPLITAGFFGLFGSSTLVLKLVAVLLSGAACILIWRVGKPTVGEPAASVAAVMFWVWPPAFVWWSVKSRGFYHAALLIGLAILLLVLRLARRDPGAEGPADTASPKAEGPAHSWRMTLLGALVATGLWCSPQTIFFTAPALLWLVVRRPSLLRIAPYGVAGAIAGAFPWWVHNLEHDWVALRSSGGSIALTAYGDHLRGFFETGLPGALGLKLADGSRWMAGDVGKTVYVMLLLLFVGAVLWEVVRGRTARTRRAARWLLLLIVIAYPLLFALSSYSWFVAHPRYLYYLTPVCALLLARGLAALRWPAIVGGLLAAMALSTAGFVTMHRDGVFFPSAEGVRIPADLDPAIDYMTERGIDHVYADYWLAYCVAFESDERIAATPYRGAVRHASADAAVRSVPEPAYLFLDGSATEPVFQDEIEAMGVPYERLRTPGFVIYALGRKVSPEALPATTAVQP